MFSETATEGKGHIIGNAFATAEVSVAPRDTSTNRIYAVLQVTSCQLVDYDSSLMG